MYNSDPQIAALEREIEMLRGKCDLLGVTIKDSKSIKWASNGFMCIHLKPYPKHDFDPWYFEKEFLERTIEMYFKKPKRFI